VGRLLTLARASDPRVRRQVILSLGENPTEATDEALLALLDEGTADAEERSWFLSGLHRREFAFMDRLVPERWADEGPGRSGFVQALARAVAREGRSDAIGALLGSIDRLWDHWSADALLDGFLAARPKGPRGGPGYFLLAKKPSTFDALARRAEAVKLQLVLGFLAWPGRADIELPEVRPLEPAELALFERGRAVYAETCEQCHLSSGTGEAGKAPPLRHSDWVLGSEERLIRIVRWGMVGPLVIDGQTWDMEMPAWSVSAEDLAALLTYVRREWGHGADPVSPAMVAAVLRDVERVQPFTVEELEEVE
ncbi:MAG: cytochrome c, partial [Planctomycetota bacterium]|nr:cytochrome c [Planctomycetota bacterium]